MLLKLVQSAGKDKLMGPFQCSLSGVQAQGLVNLGKEGTIGPHPVLEDSQPSSSAEKRTRVTSLEPGFLKFIWPQKYFFLSNSPHQQFIGPLWKTL